MLSGEQLDFIPVLGQACQQLWPVHDNDVYQQFSFLSHIAPASSLAALLWQPCRPLTVSASSFDDRATVSRSVSS